MYSILVVCSANVCRSPLAQKSLALSFDAAGLSARISVTSAGTLAREAHGICGKVGTRLGEKPGGSDFAMAHVARRATGTLIDDTQLILVPDTANRSRVATLVPLARHRTFTLVEAVDLIGRLHLTRNLDPKLCLGDLAERMHAERTFHASSPGGPRRSIFKRKNNRRNPLDVVDGHTLGAKQHTQTLDEVQELSVLFAEGVQSLLPDLPRAVSNGTSTA